MKFNGENEEELLRAYSKDPDSLFGQAALGHLLTRYKRLVYALLQNRIKEKELREDIFQDVCEKTISALRSGKEYSNLSGWVSTLTRNRIIDFWRKESREKNIISYDDESSFSRSEEGRLPLLEAIASDEKNPEELFLLREALSFVDEEFKSLPLEQKEVLLLRIEGLLFREISEMTGENLNTIIARTRYARNNIKRGLQKKGLAS